MPKIVTTSASIDLIWLRDDYGHPVPVLRSCVEAAWERGDSTLTLPALKLPPPPPEHAPPGAYSLKVADAARMLRQSVDGLEQNAVEKRIRRAIELGQLPATGEGHERRIEATSFQAWRLAQQEADLARAD